MAAGLLGVVNWCWHGAAQAGVTSVKSSKSARSGCKGEWAAEWAVISSVWGAGVGLYEADSAAPAVTAGAA